MMDPSKLPYKRKTMTTLIKQGLLFYLLITSLTLFSQQPNIILIMTDDQGWEDIGFNGHPDIKTPHLDHLASQGIILDRFYSASAVCSPTRASVITGRNPLRMNIPTANAGHMLPEEITLPELLKEQGYATAHFGKWHLGTLTQTVLDANRGGRTKNSPHYSIPTMHGYDSFFCTESKVPTYDPMVYPAIFEKDESMRYGWKALEGKMSSKPYGTAYWKGEEVIETMNLKGDNSKIIMDRVLPFMEESVKGNQPFFTTIWLHTPHLPVVSDKEHRERYGYLDLDKQLYYGTITAMDEQIGRLWSKLEALGIQQNTMLWFCSDNGPENGTPGKAGPFSERKRSLLEGGVRVPAFVVWKNHFKKGARLNFPAVTSDYLPTLLDVLDLPYPGERSLDGQSLLGLLEGTVERREQPIGFIFKAQTSWVNHRYKLISRDELKSFALYDLIKDPGETSNLFDTQPKIAAKMKAELEEWLVSVEASSLGKDY